MPALEATRIGRAFAQLRPRDFAIARLRCAFCGPSVALRLRNDDTGVRCVRCGATAVHQALGRALHKHVGALADKDVCELSARGPLVRFLRRHVRSLALSEYFADVPPGSARAGVRCEDVLRLTYATASFDLVTHTEVLEHVSDDRRAFAELHRVLRDGGLMLFTVPLRDGATLERARLGDREVEHLLPPMYHGDPVCGGAPILAFRDYGGDIVERLLAAGFGAAWIEAAAPAAVPFGFDRAVLCARK